MGLEDSRRAQKPSRIVVADDHPLFRSAIRYTLEVQPDLEVVAEAADGQEAVELCRRLAPDLVLMDLGMPVMDGVAATRAIKEESPETRVLVLTALDESSSLSDSLEAGAAGYILKDATADKITDAVRRVLAGESPLDEKVAMRLLKHLVNGATQEQENRNSGSREFVYSSTPETPFGQSGELHPADSLTSREVEILRLVVLGHTNQQIARTLFISVSTVKRHVQHISAKLGVCDRVQMAVRAVELGVIDKREGG
jgi:DNA-binding NarL/FixJ family response regulator